MDLKRKSMVVLFVICGVIFLGQVCVYGEITDVVISPEAPTDLDPITITTFGVETSGPVFINDSVFQIEETVLSLNLFITVGHLTIITPWSYSDDVGFLSSGTYNLTVSTFDEFDPTFNDTFSTTFKVVPEPASLLIMAVGMVTIQRRKRIFKRYRT